MSVAGDWRVELEFVLGSARHALHLSQEGNRVSGRYRSRFGVCDISGSVDGDRIDLRASVRHEHCGTTYGFHGRFDGHRMEGDVDLGEYWSARWRATRQE